MIEGNDRGWMPKAVKVAACLFLSGGLLSAQDGGTVLGRVVDSWNETGLSGAAITVRGTTLGTKSTGDGRYQLENVPPGMQILVFSKPGYVRATVADVKVAVGQNSNADARLAPEFYELEPFEVVVEPFDQQSAELLIDRQQGAALVDAIGSDFFSRAGASNAADIMTKVTGASVVGGKYVFIRGLGDRYSNTTLNGADIPSADPDKKAVQMDIFPSAAIESVVTAKTFTPDRQGSFSGGSVDVRTKSIPEEFFANISLGTSYNTQTTGEDGFLSYEGGSRDFLALDDGSREIPAGVSESPLPTRGTILSALRDKPRQQALADELVARSQLFSPEMWPSSKKAAPNYSMSMSTGDKIQIFKRDFGFMLGLSYDRSFSHRPEAVLGRWTFNRQTGTLVPLKLLDEVRSIDSVSWGALGSGGYRISENHEIAYNFLFNQTAEDDSRIQTGFNDDRADLNFFAGSLHYTQRQLISHQFRGEHTFPELNDMQTEWVASTASTSQDEPDFRTFPYFVDEDGDGVIAFTVDVPSRFFREGSEDNTNFKLDNTIPFDLWNEEEANLKLGYYTSRSRRDYTEQRYTYNSTSSPSFRDFTQNPLPEEFLDPARFNNTPPTRLNRFITDASLQGYDGKLDIEAVYLMTELPVVDRIRLVGGARFETSSLGVVNFVRGINNPDILEPPASLNDNFLPSASMMYSMREDMNLRLAYGRTLARPIFKEIANISTFDFANQELFVGNPDLMQTDIWNYDLRWEWFPSPGDVLAFSYFHKDLENPIEKTFVNASNTPIVQFQNRDEATVSGVEIEVRRALEAWHHSLSNWSVGMNFTWVNSSIDVAPTERVGLADRETTRALAGQSDLLANFDLTYHNDRSGTTGSLFYNYTGDRLSIVGGQASPVDVVEKGIDSLDFTLSQRLGKGFSVKFSAKNLINPNIAMTQSIGNQSFPYYTYKRGRSFGLSLSWAY